MQHALRWRIGQQFQYPKHSLAWPDGAVVYDAASGDTHHLAQAAFQLLTLLSEAPCSATALALHFDAEGMQIEAQASQETLAAVTLLLNDLHALGLIEPERP